MALAPAAFSYGPTIIRVLPNTGSTAGGDMVTILGYGFGSASGEISVTIGGQAASVQSVDALPAFRAALGLGCISPSFGSSAGGTSMTVRGSGFPSGTRAIMGGKSASVTFKDTNTLVFTTPSTSAGPQQLVLSNPDGETVSLDAAFAVQ